MVQSRLLDIAVREFGSKGLEGASTRGIAAAAGTAMSSITYHYGGKDGLYLAAADHIAVQMDDDMATLLSCEPLPADADGARVCLHELLDHFFDKMFNDREPESALFIMREQMEPTAAFDRLYNGPMGRIATQMVDLIALASGTTRALAEITAMLLFGQVIVWRASRALAARVFASAVTDPAALIRAQIARNTDVILDRLTADAQEPL